MTSKDQRQPAPDPQMDEGMIDEAITQLNAEIELLQDWLKEAENSKDENTGHRETRLAYRDKLRSRTEMREALLNQRKSLERKNSKKKS